MATKNTSSKRKASSTKNVASGKKRAANSKRATTTRNNTKTKKNNKQYEPTQEDLMVKSEIKLLILFAITAILLLSNFGLCGKLGGYLSYFMFGMFGMYAYIVPLFVIIGGAFLISNKGNRKAYIKFTATIVMLVFLCALIQMIVVGVQEGQAISDLYKKCAIDKVGGGVVGGVITNGLSSLIGVVGAYIVIIILLIASFVVITERSVINGLKDNSTKAYNAAREDIERRREESEHTRHVRDRKKEASARTKVDGVDLKGTKIAKHSEVSGEVREIKPNDAEEFTGNIHIHTRTETGVGEPIQVEEEFGYEEPKVKRSSDGSVSSQQAQAEDSNEPFVPKEKIDVKKSALAEMSRNPYQAKGLNNVNVHAGGDSDDHREVPKAQIVEDTSKNVVKQQRTNKKYALPPLHLLNKVTSNSSKGGENKLKATALKLQQTLQNFGVGVTITDVSRGPSVTRYELQPEQGTKVSKITALTDDIKLNLAAADIRIEAPIPGKAAVGIEVPNEDRDTVYFRDLIESKELRSQPSKLAFAAGKDIAGKVIVTDIAKMPHMLIAGTTGSGKSVFTNSIIMSILYRAKPSEVKFIIVDPKVVEFGVYNGIPHLLIPVVTDPKKAAGALNWAVAEMEERYKKFADLNVRDLGGYNEKVTQMAMQEDDEIREKMPQIVIIIDELADLMMVAAKEVEQSICRLAQLARAAGIHLVIATQRPSVDVVTGLIKANIPSRVALLVSSGTDSRTIIDMNGAEKLLGNGDMLFYPSGYVKPVRLQGAFVSDSEVMNVVKFVSSQGEGTQQYSPDVESHISSIPLQGVASNNSNDEYFIEAAKFVIDKEKASTSMLQRMFRIGFNRASRIMDQLAQARIVGEEVGTKPRQVLMTMEEFEAYLDTNSEDNN